MLRRAPAGEPQSLTPERAVAINSAVRAFMREVAYDVTKNGPAAWQKHFVEGQQFFMAANGNWVFQSGATAATGVQDLSASIKQIILEWGGDLRVDPLARDLAMVASPYHEIRVDCAWKRMASLPASRSMETAAGNFATRIGPSQFRRELSRKLPAIPTVFPSI